MMELETPVCDITAPSITLYSYSDRRTEKDKLGISPSFHVESLLCQSLPSDATDAFIAAMQFFFFFWWFQ